MGTRTPNPANRTAARAGTRTTAIISSDASIIGSYLSMWTQVISVGVSTYGFCGEMRTVAGTSVSDKAPTSRAPATSVGQASGQTTPRLVRQADPPSMLAMSRSSRQGRDQVPRPAANASRPNRPRYAGNTPLFKLIANSIDVH